jgi:hypothetical protein
MGRMCTLRTDVQWHLHVWQMARLTDDVSITLLQELARHSWRPQWADHALLEADNLMPIGISASGPCQSKETLPSPERSVSADLTVAK